ncbi:MAG: hypothetical protein OJF59_002787 [Cytophagales bacterium]|jgi:intracellular sulfur oxidation DsrE/DsrF family protein|nr:DsrE family protein [Bacteroidota bacterium]WHZ09033.1 MAG: hypothetical protein OJF59_002787 [Cytophagales bacterium]
MKNIFLAQLILLSLVCKSQTTPAVKIIFDVTSQDTLIHQATLRHVLGMAAAYPKSHFEVVIYGGAIGMVQNGKSTVSKNIKLLENNPNVSFKVCESTMKRYHITKSQLLPKVETVPDAIIEIVTRQAEGWGYIKEAH